jgi:hypothetical protein
MNRFEIVKKYIDEYDYYDLLACGAPNDEFDRYSRKFANTITEKEWERNKNLLEWLKGLGH